MNLKYLTWQPKATYATLLDCHSNADFLYIYIFFLCCYGSMGISLLQVFSRKALTWPAVTGYYGHIHKICGVWQLCMHGIMMRGGRAGRRLEFLVYAFSLSYLSSQAGCNPPPSPTAFSMPVYTIFHILDCLYQWGTYCTVIWTIQGMYFWQ